MLTSTSLEAKKPLVKQPNQQPYRLHFRKVAGLGTMRWLISAGVGCLLYFLWWFFTTLRIGYMPLFVVLALSLGFKVLRMLHEWMHYAQVREPVAPSYKPRLRTVDVLTTAYPGEPYDMIVHTLEAMQAIRYPHTSYLCDEGNDPALRAACARLGVVHVTRQVKVNAKAGNINNALRQATGEVCVVLDPDHAPTSDFLDQVMPYFEDEQVGFVQVVQAYNNQHESLVARGAAEQTYHFYGPMMMGMNGYGTVQAIGANCTFRRAALDSIGGHAPGLTEDMHTAMLLHAAGWQSVYVPKIVSHGLVPASLAAFYSQQLKWSRGAFDLLFRVYPKLFTQFTWAQRLHYLLLPLYFFSGVIALIDLCIPLFALGLNQFPWLASVRMIAQHALPLLGMSLLIRYYAQRWLRAPHESGLHLAGGFLRIGTWWVYTLGFVYAVIGVRVPYLPTPKEGRWGNEWLLAAPNLVLAGLLVVASKYGRVIALSNYTNMMVILALLNTLILVAAATMGQHQVVRNFVKDMSSWPYRGIVLGLHRLQASLAKEIMPRMRYLSPALALVGFVMLGAFQYRHAAKASPIPNWLFLNTQTLHLGQSLSPSSAHSLAAVAGHNVLINFTTKPFTAPDYAIAGLTIPAPTATSQLPAEIRSLANSNQIPLISWSVDAAATQQKDYWQQFARQIKQLPSAVLLRPVLTASDDNDYRRAWKNMVTTFRREQVKNTVWVWTPTANDSLLMRFPGKTYLDWVACPLVASGQNVAYATMRKQLTRNLALHQVPVLVLAPTPSASPLEAARSLTRAYPEVKIVVFNAPTQPLRSTRPSLAHGALLTAPSAALRTSNNSLLDRTNKLLNR